MKAPAFPFYAQDFLLGTRFMEFDDIGRYIVLLAFQWDSLAIPKKRLGKLVGLAWENFSPDLREKFVEDEEYIWNEVLEEKREEKRKFLEKQALNGKKGGRPKAKQNPTINPKETQTQTQKKPLEEGEEKEIEKEEFLSYLDNTTIRKSDPHSLNWRDNYSVYLQSLNDAYEYLSNNQEYIQQQEKFNPNVDIKVSLEKAVTNFYATERGWIHMIGKCKGMIDWTSQLADAISLNKVYKQNGKTFSNSTESSQGPSGTNPKLARTYSAAEQLTREIAEKSRGFASGG